MVIWLKWKNNRPHFLHMAKLNRDEPNKCYVLFQLVFLHASFNFNIIWMDVHLIDALEDKVQVCSSVIALRLVVSRLQCTFN